MRPYYYQMDLKPLRTTMYGDFLIGPCRSSEGNTVAMIHGDRSGFTKPCPLRERRLASTVVSRLHWDVGFPARMTTDSVKEFVKGHLTALSHVFASLKSHSRSKLVFDSPPPSLSLRPFDASAWRQSHHDLKERLPVDAPAPRGKAVTVICFVDADHAGGHAARRSRTGALMSIDRAPIIWLSKRQTSIETPSFGSEFTALKQATELVVALRWKSRMSGVPLDGPSHIRCDNQSVVTNASVPASALKKKDNAVASHYVRESAAAGVIDVHKESGETNLADALSKTQAWAVRQRLCDGLMH